MMTRIDIRLLGLGAIALLAVSVGPAVADDDHLKCYKVSRVTVGDDPFKQFRATVDLGPPSSQCEGGANAGAPCTADSECPGGLCRAIVPPSFVLDPGCTIKGKARMVCIPADKTVQEILPHDPRDIGPTQTLSNIRVCYAVKCPVKPADGMLLLDQFSYTQVGLGGFKASLLCLPAKRARVGDFCGSTNAPSPNCDGSCGPTVSGSRTCIDLGGGCQCISNACGGVAPACSGECPSTQACADNGLGQCECVGNPAPPCGSTAAPTCDGSCPGFATCTDVSGTCTCVSNACGDVAGAPTCLGACGQGESCLDVYGTCRCCSHSNPCP